MSDELYYIQNTGYCGNCIIFWRVDGHGYTTNLDEAWKVTREHAERICRSRPKEDIPLAASLVDSLAERHLNCERLWVATRGDAA